MAEWEKGHSDKSMSKRSDKRSPVSLSATDFDLRIAVALHHRGQLIEAEQIYQNILELSLLTLTRSIC